MGFKDEPSKVTSAERRQHYEDMLREFIKKSNNLEGMVLIAIRENDTGQEIEVSCGACKDDLYRAAATILEGILDRKDEEGRRLALLKGTQAALYHLSGLTSEDIGATEMVNKLVREAEDSGTKH